MNREIKITQFASNAHLYQFRILARIACDTSDVVVCFCFIEWSEQSFYINFCNWTRSSGCYSSSFSDILASVFRVKGHTKDDNILQDETITCKNAQILYSTKRCILLLFEWTLDFSTFQMLADLTSADTNVVADVKQEGAFVETLKEVFVFSSIQRGFVWNEPQRALLSAIQLLPQTSNSLHRRGSNGSEFTIMINIIITIIITISSIQNYFLCNSRRSTFRYDNLRRNSTVSIVMLQM